MGWVGLALLRVPVPGLEWWGPWADRLAARSRLLLFFSRPLPSLPQQTGNGKRLGQLLQIKAELRFPFRDRRSPFRGLEEERLFELLSGETDASLRPGQRVTGRVQVSVRGWCVVQGQVVLAGGPLSLGGVGSLTGPNPTQPPPCVCSR